MELHRNKTENKEEFFWQVSERLNYDERTWPDFLIADCQEFVANLHAYRLEHLLENIEDFAEYMDILEDEYTTLLEDETLAPQAQATIQGLFLLSCVEFTSASKERMLIREMEVKR
jgi:hypothetical protein